MADDDFDEIYDEIDSHDKLLEVRIIIYYSQLLVMTHNLGFVGSWPGRSKTGNSERIKKKNLG